MNVKFFFALLFSGFLFTTYSQTDTTNQIIWRTQFKASGMHTVTDFVAASDGGMFGTGYFSDSLSYRKNGTLKHVVASGNFITDAFVFKMNTQGEIDWLKTIGSKEDVSGNAVRIDDDKNVYVLGSFLGTVNIESDEGDESLKGTVTPDAFLAKYDEKGNLKWIRHFRGRQNERDKMPFVPGLRRIKQSRAFQTGGMSMDLDVHGNPVIAGEFWLSMDFDPGPGEFWLTSKSSSDGFVCKLNRNGTFVWASQLDMEHEGIVVDLTISDAGHIYIGGRYLYGPRSRLFPQSFFLAKLNKKGEKKWLKKYKANCYYRGKMLCVNEKEEIYVSGNFQGVMDADPSGAKFNLQSHGNTDVFLIKLNTHGQFLWARSYGGKQSDSSTAMIRMASGNILLAGLFYAGRMIFSHHTNNAMKGTELHNSFICEIDEKGVYKNAWLVKGSSSVSCLEEDSNRDIFVIGAVKDENQRLEIIPAINTLDGLPDAKPNQIGRLIQDANQYLMKFRWPKKEMLRYVVYFETAQHKASGSELEDLRKFMETVIVKRLSEVQIFGFADARGDADKNKLLSADRANWLRDLLVQEYSVDSTLFELNYFGEDQNRYSVYDLDSLGFDRRVELSFYY